MAKAELSRIPLAEALRDLHLRRSTGELHVRRDGREKVLAFQEGRITSVRSDAPEESLESAIRQWGLLDAEQVQALQAGDAPLEQALRSSGELAGDELDDFLEQLHLEWILELFLWEEGEVEFSKGEATGEASSSVSVPHIIVEGVRRSRSFAGVRERLLWADPVLEINEAPPVPVDALQLHPQEGYLFSLVNGKMHIKEILTLSPLDEEETLRLLYALLVLGVMQTPGAGTEFFAIRRFGEDEERRAERIEDMIFKLRSVNQRLESLSHFEVLGLEESADMDQVNEAYRRLIEKYDPDRFPEDVRRKCRRELELINARIGAAYLALTDQGMEQVTGSRPSGAPVKRLRSKEEIEADREAAAQAAREMVARARDAELGQDFHTAIRYVEMALHQNAENPEHHVYHARLLLKNPAWARRAAASLEKAIELDPENPDYHWELGQIYLNANYASKAREHLEQVAELDPDRASEIKKILKKLK